MTIENKKGGSNWRLVRIRNTRLRPNLIGKGNKACPPDPKLPFTGPGEFATHRWVPGSN
jgi:hypothetical protein